MQNCSGIAVENIKEEDWHIFLRLAAAEGWRVTDREIELFRGPFADHAFTLRSSEVPCGFVTAVPHGRNGWIGNLLVADACRGRGYGSALLDHAIESLLASGAQCIWLTASDLGRPLYERRGFSVVDGVDRWSREGEGVRVSSKVSDADVEAVIAADARAWGGSRARLLRHLAVDAEACSVDANLALLQAPGPMRVLGPWCREPGGDPAASLSAAVALTAFGIEIVADILRSAKLDSHLEEAGFRRQGYNALMAQGAYDHVDLSRVVSLASLGGMG